MHSQHLPTALQTLYRVFILPALSNPATKAQRTPGLRLQQPSLHHRRPFSQHPAHQAKTRAAEQRAQKWNEEIQAQYITLVNEATNKLSDPVPLHKTLKTFDHSTHRLIQLSPDPEGYDMGFTPTCKIMSKKDHYASEKRKKEQAKVNRKANRISGEDGAKTIELNWAIDGNDLGHRLDKLRAFLAEGRRVEVVLAAKKRGRKASRDECEDLLWKVRASVDKVEGARIKEELQGNLGGVATLAMQGRPIAGAIAVEESGDQYQGQNKEQKIG